MGCIQFLQPQHIIFKMVYYFCFERVMKAVKKSVNCKKVVTAFDLLIEKQKKFKDEKDLNQLASDNIKAGLPN